MMILKIKDDCIYNEFGDIYAVLTDAGKSEEVAKTIELGSELIPKVKDFITNVNAGSFKPKTSVKAFENLFYKYE